MNIRARDITIFALLTIVALGAVTLAGWWHPNAPDTSMQMYLPQLTVPTLIISGLVDDINLCAFTVLLLFITTLTPTLKTGEQNVRSLRIRLIGTGGINIAAIFLTYLALGIGLLNSLSFFTQQHLPVRLAALIAVLLGLWMLKDYDLGWRLQAAARLGTLAQQMGKKAIIPALVLGGFLIGLCTLPCSGAVYLAVLSLLALQPTALAGLSLSCSLQRRVHPAVGDCSARSSVAPHAESNCTLELTSQRVGAAGVRRRRCGNGASNSGDDLGALPQNHQGPHLPQR